MKIELHIERVILDGVPMDQPRVLRRALERELSNRLKEGGLSPEFRQSAAVPYVGGETIEIRQGQPATRLSTQVARAVYRGIGGRR